MGKICLDCLNVVSTRFNNGGQCLQCGSDNSISIQSESMNLTFDEMFVLQSISKNKSFWQAMIDLRQKDIIEYELKISQFRAQIEQQKRTVQQQNNQPHCPYCDSINIKKISGTERVASIAALSIFSKKINKNFKCKNCGVTW